MPYKHQVGVEDVAVELYGLEQLSQPEVTDEINRRIDEGELDNGGRHVSLAWVRTAVAGTERVQADWSFAKATPEEVELIAPVYEWAISNEELDPWPNPVEADWWVKLRTLAPHLPYHQVFRVGRFAALRPAARQQAIAATWMLWSVRGGDELERHRLPARVKRASSGYQVGGTAIVEMYDEAAVPDGGAAVP